MSSSTLNRHPNIEFTARYMTDHADGFDHPHRFDVPALGQVKHPMCALYFLKNVNNKKN
jgi:hypothetical protein